LRPEQYCWPDGYRPEAAAWERVDGFLDVAGAMAMALEGERRSHPLAEHRAQLLFPAPLGHQALSRRYLPRHQPPKKTKGRRNPEYLGTVLKLREI
jgi:hypothetical protein